MPRVRLIKTIYVWCINLRGFFETSKNVPIYFEDTPFILLPSPHTVHDATLPTTGRLTLPLVVDRVMLWYW